MKSPSITQLGNLALQWAPLLFLIIVLAVFGSLSPRFLSTENLSAILTQASWLVVVALGVNFVLLTGGVDLSVGAAMYVAAVVIGLLLPTASVANCLMAAIVIGGLFGAVNGLLITRLGLPAFIVTLATIFVGRGLGLFLSSTKIVFASTAVAEIGRAKIAGLPFPLWVAVSAVIVGSALMRLTPFGAYVRSVGADKEGARRVGVPVSAVTLGAYCLCGAFAGLGGFISLSQTSAASGAFGQNAEFFAIAAAVLGGTSLFGGRGSLRAPVIGAAIIGMIQNGLGMVNANPYIYPLITGTVIFLAAVLDSVKLRAEGR